MVDINNPSNYKTCRKKQADYWMCIPPKGTVVLQKFEQASLVEYFKRCFPNFANKLFLTSEEMLSIRSSNMQLFNFIIQTCDIVDNQKSVVLCGTEGELWTVSYDYACNNYLAYHSNSLVAIHQVLNDRAEKYKDENVVDWFRVQNKKSTNDLFACFVPVEEQGKICTGSGLTLEYNARGIPHGKGDFIICANIGGRPNLAQRWVVNGLVFSNTYDNRGWASCISIARMSIPEPVKLWNENTNNEVSSSNNELSTRDYLLSWYKSHNLVNFHNLVANCELNKDILAHLKQMINIANYLTPKYNFKLIDTETESSLKKIEDLKYSFFAFKKDNNTAQLYYNNSLCGWNATDYADDPYECHVIDKSDIDEFVDTLINNPSTYNIIINILRSIKDSDVLIKAFDSLSEGEKKLLNSFKLSQSRLKLYLWGILYLYKNYSTAKEVWVTPDEDNNYLQISTDYQDTYLNVQIDFETSAITAYTHLGDTDTELEIVEILQNIIVKSDFNKFATRVQNKDVQGTIDYNVASPSLSKAIVFSEEDAVYFKCGSLKVCCKNSDMPYYIEAIPYKSMFFKYINYRRDDIRPYAYPNGYKELKPDQFFEVLTNHLDKIMKHCKYNLGTMVDLGHVWPKGRLKVLGQTKVGRIFCELEHFGGCEYINISKSTLDIIKYEYPNFVSESFCEKPAGIEFKPMHYFQVMIRLSLFENACSFKNLKKQFIEYNHSIFNDVIPRNTICSAYNYGKEGFRIDENYAGALTRPSTSVIMFNATRSDLQKSELSLNAKLIMLHEMCHCYTQAIYGTTRELEGEDGGSYYHLDEQYKAQFFCHGKRFGEAVELVSKKTGYTFEDIFQYGMPEEPKLNVGLPPRLTLSTKNAFDFGQAYRKLPVSIIGPGTYCVDHNKLNCSCSSTNKVPVEGGRYLGLCRSCGKLHSYTDETIAEISDEPLELLDVIDRIGLVALTKCDCGGSLNIVLPGQNQELLRTYLEDLNFANRYTNHMLSLCNSNKNRYEDYFKKNYNCNLEITRGKMPCLSIKIANNNGFRECYKLFISCSITKKPIGKLYRDYGMEYKGAHIHTFRINTDKNVLDFLEYVMTYIRKNLSES